MFGRKRRERAAVAERARKDLAYEQWVTEKKLLWEENKDIYRQEWEKVNPLRVIVLDYGSRSIEILGHSWAEPGTSPIQGATCRHGRSSCYCFASPSSARSYYRIYQRVYAGEPLSINQHAQKVVASFWVEDVYGIYFKDAVVTSNHDEPTATS